MTKLALQLYKSLIRESNKFTAYNFRKYAVRRIQDGFRANKHVTDPIVVEQKLEEAAKNLEMIKRQALIGSMYATDKLVIENQ